jgi:uncharacterized protein
MSDVVDNADEGRFELTVDGHTGVLVYRRDAERLVLVHTEVPDELEGRGIGSTLVRAALDTAEREHLVVVPLCPFASAWLRAHADDARRVTIDWG